MSRGVVSSALVILLTAGIAGAQTAPSTATTPSTTATQPKTTTSSTGSFDSLSPGNQKIVQALCAAQAGGCGAGDLDKIAAMKPRGMGWGEFFHKNSTLFPGANNLGEAVSNFERVERVPATVSGTTTPSGKAKSEGAASKGRDDQEGSSAMPTGESRGHGGFGGRGGGRR